MFHDLCMTINYRQQVSIINHLLRSKFRSNDIKCRTYVSGFVSFVPKTEISENNV